MAIKLVAERKFTHRVKVQTPVDGGHKEETLKVTYRVLDAVAVEAFDLATTEGTTDFLREVISHLDDIVGEDNAPIPYSDELRDEVLKVPYIRAALGRGYFEAIGKGRKGN